MTGKKKAVTSGNKLYGVTKIVFALVPYILLWAFIISTALFINGITEEVTAITKELQSVGSEVKQVNDDLTALFGPVIDLLDTIVTVVDSIPLINVDYLLKDIEGLKDLLNPFSEMLVTSESIGHSVGEICSDIDRLGSRIILIFKWLFIFVMIKYTYATYCRVGEGMRMMGVDTSRMVGLRYNMQQ